MPAEAMKLSIKPRPLTDLYSKYAPQAGAVTNPVRPLGVVRKFSDTGESTTQRDITKEEKLCDFEKVYLYLEGGGMDGKKIPYLTPGKYLNEVLNSARDDKTIQRLSKSQTFQNQFKLAASRDSLSANKRLPHSSSRRIVNLPMYKVKVNTYSVENEDSLAVESTRKSLRKLIETGKVRTPDANNGVVSANITNFQFGDLRSEQEIGQQRTPKCFAGHTLTTDVHGKTYHDQGRNSTNAYFAENWGSSRFRTSPLRRSRLVSSDLNASPKKSYISVDFRRRDTNRMDVKLDNMSYSVSDTSKSAKSRFRASEDEDFGSGDDTVSFIQLDRSSVRPKTCMTVRTTLDYINELAISNSPRFDDMEPQCADEEGTKTTITTSMKFAASDAIWLRDIRKKKIEAWRHASDVRKHLRNNSSRTTIVSTNSEAVSAKRPPKFRYTQQPTKGTIPQTIIVPSHTNMECPMCNIHTHAHETTRCPPNSPTPHLLEFEDERRGRQFSQS